MINIDDISLSYGGDILLENISFNLNAGERLGLIGRNGSGKTTLFRLLVGQEIPDKGQIFLPKGYRLGYLDQHIRFTKNTVLEEAAEGLAHDEKDHLYKAEAILFGLGFKEEDMDASPFEFSGGYQLRLHLAKVLLSEPNCLLLDEPTNYLDILSIRFLTHFLQDWKGELILISHDREFLDSVTTHILGLHRKKGCKLEGKTDDYFYYILQQEEIYEKTRVKQEKTRAHLQSYIDRFGAKASKAAQAQSKKKKLDKMPVFEELKKIYQLDFHFTEQVFNGKKLIDFKNIDFSFTDQPLIRDVSLSIEKGDRVAIIGKNGYGKSTLLRLFAKDLVPQKGDLFFANQVQIGYFGQTHIQRLKDNLTIEEEIASANRELRISQVRNIAGLMMFGGDKAKKKISVLSGGEKSRVLLGKILATPCNLLLLDEPTHHLDLESIEALIDAVEEFKGAVLIVTHSEFILHRLEFNKLIVCHKDKQEIFPGNYEDFLEKVGWEEEKPIKKEKVSSFKKKKASGYANKIDQIEKEILECESKLKYLTEERDEEISKLHEASEKKQTEGLVPLLKKMAAREKEIEDLQKKIFNLYEKI